MIHYDICPSVAELFASKESKETHSLSRSLVLTYGRRDGAHIPIYVVTVRRVAVWRPP